MAIRRIKTRIGGTMKIHVRGPRPLPQTEIVEGIPSLSIAIAVATTYAALWVTVWDLYGIALLLITIGMIAYLQQHFGQNARNAHSISEQTLTEAYRWILVVTPVFLDIPVVAAIMVIEFFTMRHEHASAAYAKESRSEIGMALIYAQFLLVVSVFWIHYTKPLIQDGLLQTLLATRMFDVHSMLWALLAVTVLRYAYPYRLPLGQYLMETISVKFLNKK